MKSKLLLLFSAVFLFSAPLVKAQTSTKGFSFQGYAIDPDGKSLGSAGITVRFTLSSVSNGATPFTEEHVLTSDAFGVFTAIVGNSSTAKNIEFSKLDFTKQGDDDYTLKVEVKKTSGGTYTTISNSPMNAVPYARKAENGVPVGTVVAFAGAKANIPAGWFYCDGTQLNVADYPQLYGAIGAAWGSATAGVTFNIPDMRAQFLRGVSDGTNRDPGALARLATNAGGNTGDNVGTFQGSDNLSHTHFGTTTAAGNHAHNYTAPYSAVGNDVNWISGNNGAKANEFPDVNAGVTTTNGNHTHSFTTQGSGGGEARPVNVGVYYIIKY